MLLMRNRTSRSLLLMAAAFTAGIPMSVETARAGESADFAKVLADKASVLVTIKFVLKVKMGPMMGGDHESENEITGVMIDSKGLILCSNTQLGGFAAMMKRMIGSMGGDISATPSDLKVLIGDEAEEHDAELLARDTELDLAWVRIKEPGDKAFDHVDFAKGVKPRIGQRVVMVRRLDKFFGRTPAVLDGRIGGITNKPRELYIPAGAATMANGLPVYTENGQVVGVTVMQTPEEDDVEMNPMAMFGRVLGMQDMMTGLILPAADVAKATKRAMESIQAEMQE